MKVGVQFQRLYHVQIQRFLFVLGIVGSVAVLVQLLVFPYKSYISALSYATKASAFMTVESTSLRNCSRLPRVDVVQRVVKNASDSKSEDNAGDEIPLEGTEKDYYFRSADDEDMDNSLKINEDGQTHNEITSDCCLGLDKSVYGNSSTQEMGLEFQLDRMGHVKESDKISVTNTFSTLEEVHNLSDSKSPSLLSMGIASSNIENVAANSRTPLSSIAENLSSAQDEIQLGETQSKDTSNKLFQIVSASWSNNSLVAGKSIIDKRGTKSAPISQMNILLLRDADASKSMKAQLSSPRDRELQFARSQIENAPIIRNSPELYASVFRNVSMFKRSYELMEHILKVYIYKEGDKPIFHQPHLRGIYASEGWFMKLMEGNKQFVARDPRKAHLFYLPFSSLKLRSALQQEPFALQKALEKYLKNYTDTIAKKYRFWNKGRGVDHFLVACHDWAPRITEKNMGNCIRALCNANVARGFRIGKDVSLPVTYIRTSQDPQKDLGGKPPTDRPIIAFFAGGMHGYVRPILLHYWENKEPDIKIFGPMPRDIDGKAKYREYMKSSKYCICARGYEVHTPRIVEAIYYGCVPVIISDNYVPPFFEVLDWEAFSVFVLEKDIPYLRSILLSIPEEKYLAMQQRVKMVQQYFLWHKKPVKYDLFHMILHSVWFNRVFHARL